MPKAETADAAPALKEMFNTERYKGLAKTLAVLVPRFDAKRFLQYTLDGLAERSLIQRVRRTTEALRLTLPQDYPKALGVLDKLAPEFRHNFASIVLADFVGLYGLAPEHRTRSLEALQFYTGFGSAEFAIREFLKADLNGTLAVMTKWAEHENDHVRRLASEGSRPRLPWSFRLDPIVKDPELTAPILQRLMKDPSLYVRKSVANHLNDVSKDHPDWLIAWLSRQDLAHPSVKWIANRALRTLIKQGHPGALKLVGASGKPQCDNAKLNVSPAHLRLGERLTIAFACTAGGKKVQQWVIDYAVHYVKSSGATSRKVFKWKVLQVSPGETITLGKTQRIQDFTTRKHHPGKHAVDVMINGVLLADASFDLKK